MNRNSGERAPMQRWVELGVVPGEGVSVWECGLCRYRAAYVPPGAILNGNRRGPDFIICGRKTTQIRNFQECNFLISGQLFAERPVKRGSMCGLGWAAAASALSALAIFSTRRCTAQVPWPPSTQAGRPGQCSFPSGSWIE